MANDMDRGTERQAHFGKSGTVTARLVIKVSGEREFGSEAADFVGEHRRGVKEAFLSSVSEEADRAFADFQSRGCAYRFRPYLLEVEYSYQHGGMGRKRGGDNITLTVTMTLSSSRRILVSRSERHRFVRGMYIPARRPQRRG